MKKRHLDTAIFGDPAHEQSREVAKAGAGGAAPARHRSEHRRARRRRAQGRRRVLVLLLTLGLVAGAGVVATRVLASLVSSVTATNDYTGAGSGAVSVTVGSGDTGRSIGATLQKAGVVKSAKTFVDAAAANPRGSSIQPGEYVLRGRMSATSALAMLLDPANRTIPRVTIREGLWASEVIKVLSTATGQPLADYQVALKDPATLGLPAGARGDAEGYLYPATYEFGKDTTAAEQLNTMVAKSIEELTRIGVDPTQMQRVLTIASLVQAEAKASADFPKVARVIDNRLARPMSLQLDSTVSFISRRREVTTTNAERANRSAYNTYLRAGLPPGPIDSPGLLAMQAALNPTPGPWLFFVAVNPETGETRYAVDAAGHAANVRLFQRWCSGHPGRC